MCNWILTSFIALRSARLSCKRKSKRNQWTTVGKLDILRKYCLKDLEKSQHKLLFLSHNDFNICLPSCHADQMPVPNADQNADQNAD